jgi:glycogen synthase
MNNLYFFYFSFCVVFFFFFLLRGGCWGFFLPSAGLAEVIIYSSPDDRRKNRGFCFLEYDSHKSASLAKRRLSTGRVKIFGCDIIVDWADPQEEPDNDTMSRVKYFIHSSFNFSFKLNLLHRVFC